MATKLAELSGSQQQVYDLLVQGMAPELIADTLNMTLGVVNAQITRIRHKGIALPGDAGYSPQQAQTNPSHINPADAYRTQTERPPATGGSDNDRIADVLQQSGTAIDAEQLRQLAEKVGGSAANDIHPMILLGVTIQFVKLCGGRMTAHQVIEDVYTALRQFSAPLPDDGGSTAQMPKTAQERLAFLEEQNRGLQEQLTALRNKTANL